MCFSNFALVRRVLEPHLPSSSRNRIIRSEPDFQCPASMPLIRVSVGQKGVEMGMVGSRLGRVSAVESFATGYRSYQLHYHIIHHALWRRRYGAECTFCSPQWEMNCMLVPFQLPSRSSGWPFPQFPLLTVFLLNRIHSIITQPGPAKSGSRVRVASYILILGRGARYRHSSSSPWQTLTVNLNTA